MEKELEQVKPIGMKVLQISDSSIDIIKGNTLFFRNTLFPRITATELNMDAYPALLGNGQK